MSVKKIKGVWHIEFMYDGRRIKKSAGKGATQKQAEALERQLRQEAIDRSLGFEPDKTISEAVEKWIKEYVYPYKGKKGLVKPQGYISHARAVYPFIEGRLLIEADDVCREMVDRMRDDGLAIATIKQRVNIIKRPTTLAYTDWKWLRERVDDKFPKVGTSNVKRVFLSREQIDTLAQACDNDFARDMIYFLAYTGIRWAEFTRLNDSSLQGDNDVLHIEGKGYRSRYIPIHDEQAAFVEAYIPLQVSYSYIRWHFNRAKAKVGFDEVTIHDLRHSYGTMLAESGTPRSAIMELMGHATEAMSRVYTRLDVSHLVQHAPLQDNKKADRIAPVLTVVGSQKD